MWMITLDTYKTEIKIMIKIITFIGVCMLMLACGYHSCPTYAQGMEEYIPADSTVTYNFPVVVMDIGVAAAYYADKSRLEDLREKYPIVSAQIDSLQEVNNDIDSINAVIIARLEAQDSLSTVQLTTCESKANAILREAKRQDARANKAWKRYARVKKQRNISFGTALGTIALLLILI